MIEEWDCQSNLLKHLKNPILKEFKDACQSNKVFSAPPSIWFCGAPLM